MHASYLAILALGAAVAQALPNNILQARQATPPATCGKAKSYPSTCGEVGYLKTPAAFADAAAMAANTLPDCINACKASGSSVCPSFSFNTTSSVCQFYSKLPAKMGFTKQKGSAESFYASTCFNCTSCTATLTNGGFESDMTNPWWTQDETAVSIVSPGSGGSKYAFSGSIPEASGGFAGTAYLSQFVNWCEGTNYTISFDYQAVDTESSGLFLEITNLNTYQQTTGFSTFDFTYGQWEHASFTYIAPYTAGELAFNFYNEGYGVQTFLIDNVVVAITA